MFGTWSNQLDIYFKGTVGLGQVTISFKIYVFLSTIMEKIVIEKFINALKKVDVKYVLDDLISDPLLFKDV